MTSFRFLVLALIVPFPALAQPAPETKTPLDEYIARPDPAYAWTVARRLPGEGVTTFVLEMTSQRWRRPPEVDRADWRHWLTITCPRAIRHETALLFIGGGKNGDPAPEKPGERAALIAAATGSVVAELSMVPNQPLVFNDDGKPRVEDDLIAYGWVKCMETGDFTWLPRFAMVKAAVRAMDTVTAFLATPEGGERKIDKFVVSGGSKRGWTTWLTGAVDPRVVAIIPIVIDILNVQKAKEHHWRAYGFWAPAVGDYSAHGIHRRLYDPEYEAILRIVDPYSYRRRLTMPKFIVNAGGDEFFLPDNSRFYFADLEGPKYLRYVPNAKHSLQGSDAVESIAAFYHAILIGAELPKFDWNQPEPGHARVTCQTKPREVLLWQATNPSARDFRLDSIGPAYQKTALAPEADGSYLARVAPPKSGWTAYMVEMTFDSGFRFPYKFTTPIWIIPDVLPHDRADFLQNGLK